MSRIVIEKDIAIPMRDGCVLKADLYRPDGPGETAGTAQPHAVRQVLPTDNAQHAWRGSRGERRLQRRGPALAAGCSLREDLSSLLRRRGARRLGMREPVQRSTARRYERAETSASGYGKSIRSRITSILSISALNSSAALGLPARSRIRRPAQRDHQPTHAEEQLERAALVNPSVVIVACQDRRHHRFEARRTLSRGEPLRRAHVGSAERADLAVGPRLARDELDRVVLRRLLARAKYRGAAMTRSTCRRPADGTTSSWAGRCATISTGARGASASARAGQRLLVGLWHHAVLLEPGGPGRLRLPLRPGGDRLRRHATVMVRTPLAQGRRQRRRARRAGQAVRDGRQ